jgi:carbon storage regulator CsrA
MDEMAENSSHRSLAKESKMLVLSRKVGEEIVIGNNIRLVVTRIAGERISIGISAPNSTRILRGELVFENPKAETVLAENSEFAA